MPREVFLVCLCPIPLEGRDKGTDQADRPQPVLTVGVSGFKVGEIGDIF